MTYDESTDPNAAKIFLASNGVTIKCPNAEVGYTEEVNGKVYEVVDNVSLKLKSEMMKMLLVFVLQRLLV